MDSTPPQVLGDFASEVARSLNTLAILTVT